MMFAFIQMSSWSSSARSTLAAGVVTVAIEATPGWSRTALGEAEALSQPYEVALVGEHAKVHFGVVVGVVGT